MLKNTISDLVCKYAMRYYSSQASWCYKEILIDQTDLDIISLELRKICKLTMVKRKKLFTNNGVACWDRHLYQDYGTTLIKWLHDLDVYDYFIGSYFSIVGANSHLSIHIDTNEHDAVDGTVLNLLVPVSNCKNSWTIWYDADFAYNGVEENIPKNGVGRTFDSNTAIEVCRIESTVPYWVNPLYPHGAVTGNLLNPGPRIAASLRFSNDILQNKNIINW